ncbi:MAG: type II toxin-antitoxin system RelE/ParE family toxin [Chloroflexota bacterium]
MNPEDKPLVWLSGEIKTPPLSSEARIEAGFLLRQLQAGVRLSLPHLRPMPSLGARCHELRVQDAQSTWRVMLRIDADAIVILDVFRKTSSQTPRHVLDACRRRLRRYDELTEGR